MVIRFQPFDPRSKGLGTVPPDGSIYFVKLPGHGPGLPGHVVASGKASQGKIVLIVPLDPAYKAGLRGTCRSMLSL